MALMVGGGRVKVCVMCTCIGCRMIIVKHLLQCYRVKMVFFKDTIHFWTITFAFFFGVYKKL
jgi:hypothetical protein